MSLREDPSGPVPLRLLPDTATVDGQGRMSVGGCDLVELAERHGTPLFVYDEAHLRARCREAVAAFGPGVAYASKAFLCTAMARLVDEEGMGIDVSTAGELHVALHAGVSPERMVLHGNNKSTAELERALEVGVGRIVVDSFDELDRLDRLAGGPVRVLVRVTPGVEAHTHEFVQTGRHDSKFGFGLRSGQAAEAVARVQASDVLDLAGVHVHIGSQIFATSSFERSVQAVADFVRPLQPLELSLGGGLGVPYVVGEEAPTLMEWAATLREACVAEGLTEVDLTAEPGRAVAAAAGITLYRVGTVKRIPDVNTYVSVDGGMSDNPRPVLYGSGYEAFLSRAAGADRTLVADVVGKHCETGDFVVKGAHLPADVQVGDVLVTPVTGAYGYSMASNYNKVTRPAVVFVADGSARVVVRRETFEDLVRLDG